MAMTKRERSIGLAVGAVLGIWLLDVVLIEPLWAARDDLGRKIAAAQDDLKEAKKLIARKPILDDQFSKQKSEGLAQDISTAQRLMVDSLGLWGQQTGVEVTSITPSGSPTEMPKLGGKPNEKEKSFKKLSCQASIKGRMEQIGRFLFLIQTSQAPIRVSELGFEPEKEGQDGLKITLRVSTIFLSSESATGTRGVATPSSTRPGAAPANATPQTGGATRPATSAAPTALQAEGSIVPNASGLSVEEQMKLRRQQQSQPQAVNVAPATAPASQPETR